MKIFGIEKTTLIDYPEKIACVIFLWGCNFRCGFCYNPDLVIGKEKENFSRPEILNFLESRKGKLDGVCITGGEPLISLDLGFLREIKGMGYLIKIDTNGSFPEKLKEIIDNKLVDYIAMDIKASKENYSKITNVKTDLEKVEESIKMIFGLENYEFRTTILEGFHDAKEVEKIGGWLNKVCNGKPKKYFLQGFKNKGDFVDKEFTKEKDTTEDFLSELKKIAEKYFDEVEVRV